MFKDKRFFIGAIVLVFLLIAAFFFFGEKGGSSSKAGGGVNLVAVGEIPSLAQAMKKDSVLRRKVKELLSYDASYVFENHAQVNGIIVEILFRWSGLSGSALENISGARGVEYFLRAHHGLPDDEPIFNNPYLGENPWPKLFQRYRARLL
ncbi:MAG: hypothetical protein MRY79_06800, partial [Alphaproteobacteria bacterium]|nr:hypothetical protein [Alphaproteobacteria bacterium]